MGEIADLHPLVADDGTPLRYRSWEAPSSRAAVLLVHGLGEHSGRYDELAGHLGREGVSVFAPDLRGHGLSGGSRGHVAAFDEYLTDLDLVFAEVARRLPAAPMFLLGHSLGGLIALRYGQQRPDAPIRGLILSSPVLRQSSPPPRWLHRLLGLLSATFSDMPLGNRIDPEHLTQDAAAVAAYREDPLVHDIITPRLYREMTRAMTSAIAETDLLRVSEVLVLVSGADRVVDPAATLELASELSRRVKVEVRGYSGFYHECFNEIERPRPLADLTRWLLARTA